MSAFTTVSDETISKLKELAKEIDAITWEYSTFKEDSKFYELQSKQNEILTLINKL